MSSGSKFTIGESLCIDQFVGLDWTLVTCNCDAPSVNGHETWRKVLIKSALACLLEERFL